ncbi:hypothetical protein MNEG_16042 [Monoraphidium neglectum]|uniref:SF4 helicase domain-containing protein n=1 Tax=Monoraphidium neglectum TaxID=145388 RepID=A0A0D2LPJ2_9CHLO|nr:hypothetical protein MNEG_16042 [Monoraphidium neglectum]KIY91921.1 hypothetical protein MNEG_16042 [Monoraphidium neglectum]|eukprot:XP_013890941.1 hypothetical protein MNEG_16042 [Monoraphidium neglectum]
MDKLALNEAGFQNVLSVPDGAPAKPQDGPLPDPRSDAKFGYLRECEGLLALARRVILAADNDAPGFALTHELARRLGRDRCLVVQWPSDEGGSLAGRGAGGAEAPQPQPPQQQAAPWDVLGGGGGDGLFASNGNGASGGAGAAAAAAAAPPSPWFRKDANEVLLKDGPAALREYVAAAQPLPVPGLQRFASFWEELLDLYAAQAGGDGREAAASTGWGGVDGCYKVPPGELTLVTGVPNSGKSEWLDALAVNLAAQQGWRIALCSLENEPVGHLIKLLEKRVGKPFYDGAGGRVRMSWEEAVAGALWVDEMFHRIVPPPGEQLPTIDFVLERARILVLRFGIRGLIIDPYNELDHRRPSHVTETEFVSQMLARVKRFAQAFDVHVWLVAHPRQLQDWRGEAPNLYDVSGRILRRWIRASM